MLISDVMCLWVSSFRKKGGMWCLKRILSLTGREVMRERETVHVILDKMRERDERGMRDERERDRSRQFWSQSWLGQGEMKCLFFLFFFCWEKRERVCVCVCVWSKVWLVMICSGPLYLIFFSLFALEHEEAYEWRGIWLRVRWCDTIISELIDMV